MQPSPHIDWSAGTVRLLAEGREWAQQGRTRRAAISAFGISGTNAHLILEQAPPEPVEVPPEPEGGAGLWTEEPGLGDEGRHRLEAPRRRAGENRAGEVLPWVVSGRGEAALRAQAGRLAGVRPRRRGLAAALSQSTLGWTLAVGPVGLREHRAVIPWPGTRPDVTAGLQALAAGQPACQNRHRTGAGCGFADKVAFVFRRAGIAADWHGTDAGARVPGLCRGGQGSVRAARSADGPAGP